MSKFDNATMEEGVARDRFGREFLTGSRVVYAVRQGNVGALIHGTVVKVIPVSVWRWFGNERRLVFWFKLTISVQRDWGDKSYFTRTLYKVENCVVVP